ncbi:SIS domain-containing protein [Oscillospiraceae bacterium PP1C4]
MKTTTQTIIHAFFEKWQPLAFLQADFTQALQEAVRRIRLGGKVLVCGNGGSAADCEHIVGELLKEFYIKRPIPSDVAETLSHQYGEMGAYMAKHLQGAIPAVSLVSQSGFLTAYANDAASDMAYAQQVFAYATANDVLIGISTSGNAANVNYAAAMAQTLGCYVIAMTGKTGGKLKAHCDALMAVPETETYLVQEYHLPLYHLLCRAIENEIFGE